MPLPRTLHDLATTALEVCPNSPTWFYGLDLGQRQDHSALATLERRGRRLVIRSLTRFPLGTSYEDIFRLVRATIIPGGIPQIFAIDAAGPGLPIVDRLRRHNLPAVSIQPLFITNGQTPGTVRNGCSTTPRHTLIANLQLALTTHVLTVSPSLHNATLLEQELATIHKPNERDDLAIATALALHAAL